MDKIYTHDEAARIVDMFEQILFANNIRIPSPEDDERDTNDEGLYGSVYSDLLDGIEDNLIEMLNACKNGNEIINYEFSGNF